MDCNRDGSEESLRRITEEYSRHKLADVKEENEDDMALTSASPARRTRYSSLGSAASSSMDYLWDLHPRRLSEAGLSRHSDNSTILTEDTDSFIIGQRVWVGGTKPGHIAYIGETQFAPGDWAGIALDHPIGKNDGSVAGTRYFQCEPKKGIFSRLTRLTRYPLDGETGGAGDYITSTPINGTRNSVSPTGSSSPFKSPPSLTTSNTSLSSALLDFKIGDRVIIKSSQGSKIGTLRFLGCTEFAAGEWCGVELDEPRGKNDGSVGGKRYFDCRPNFGLFAPVSKVSKSPSSRKPGGCVIHSGTGIPPSGFRRANSKESLTSNVSITSAASGVRRVRLGVTSLTTPQKTSPKPTTAPIPTRTVLQEVLKEKQQHIEQLLKERDLERAELARAASQADEAEHKFITVKQEYDLYRDETEKKLLEHLKILDQLKRDRTELIGNLEDEKRKVEDLQFRYEEAEISKSDLEQKLSNKIITDEANQSRIRELEAEIDSNKQKIESLEADSNKLFEAEESLLRLREEKEALRYEIEVAAKKILSLESDGISSKSLEQSLQKESSDLKNIIKERDDVIDKFKKDITQVSEQFESARSNFIKELEEHKKKLEESNKEVSSKDLQIGQLKEELIKVENSLVEKSKSFESNVSNSKAFEDKMTKEVNKLKMELSSKTHDIEENVETIVKKDEEIKKLTSQIQNITHNLQSQNVDFDQYRDNLKEIETNLRKELEESRNAMTAKITEFEEIKKDLALNVAQKESELKDTNKIIQNQKEEIEKLNYSLNQIKDESINSKEEIRNIFELKLKESEDKVQKLNNDLQDNNTELAKVSLNLSQLENEIFVKVEGVKRLENELESSKKSCEEQNISLTKSNEEATKLLLDLGDLERKLKISEDKNTELTQNKTKLESEIQNLLGSSGDFSAKLEELSKELRTKENLIDNIKSELTSKLQDVERSKHEIELQYNNLTQKSEKDLIENEEKLRKEILEKEALKQEIGKICSENKNSIEALNIKLGEYQKSFEEKDQLLKKTQDERNQIEAKLKEEIRKNAKDFSDSMLQIQNKLSEITKENEDVKSEIKNKSVELIECTAKFNKEIELSKQNEHNMKAGYEEKIKILEIELDEKQKEYQKILESSKSDISEKLLNMESKNKEFDREKLKLIEDNQKIKVEFEEQLKLTKEECQNIKKDFEEKLEDRTKSIEDMVTKFNALNEELRSRNEIITKMQSETKIGEDNLKEKVEKTIELETKTKDLENKIQEITTESGKTISELELKLKKSLENEINFQKSIQDLQHNESSLKATVDLQLKELTEKLNTKSNELGKVNEELTNLKQQISTKETSSSEKDNQITQLKSELQINHEFIEKLQKESKDLQQQKEDANKGLSETQTFTSKLNEEISKLNEELKTSGKMVFDLNHATNLYMTVLQMLNLTEKQKIEVVDKLNDVVKEGCDEESYSKLCKMVDGIKINCDVSEEAKQLKETQEELFKYKKMYVEAEDKIAKKDAEISSIKNEYQALSQPTKIPKPKIDNPSTSSSVNNNPASNEQLLEEKVLAESQIAFLNSIIVDMHKKNEEQKARIELLEMGYSPAAVQELGLLGLAERRLPAPRMYCDICEEFDLHETEDCPQQASDDPPPRQGPKKEKPPPRPYCEICEEFGHATENCQDDRTF